MADITMCRGEHCKLKENCYRYLAKPDAFQSYFIGIPFIDNYGCDDYLKLLEEK